MTFQAYLEMAMRQPNLEPDEERVLVARMRANDDAARTSIVEAHVKLIAKIARPYVSDKFSFEDLVQEGIVGFLAGLQRYAPDNETGARVGTYCAWYVRASILELVQRQHSLVRLSASAAAKRVFFNVRRVMAERGIMDADRLTGEQEAEIAAALSVPVAVLQDTLARMQTLARLDGPLSADDADGGTLIETLADESIIPADELISDEQERRVVRADLEARLAELTPREREIVTRRIMCDPPAKLRELAEELQISRQRVEQLTKVALWKLRGRPGNSPSYRPRGARKRMKAAA